MVVGTLSRLLGGNRWDSETSIPPWGDRPSIYAHLRAHIVEGKPGLAAGGERLPDQAEVLEERAARGSSGAMDAGEPEAAGGSDEERADKLFRLLQSALKHLTEAGVQKLYAAVRAGGILECVDALLERVRNDGEIDPEQLHRFALWLATKAADREPVKLGLAILRVVQGRDDREVISTLARHEEFTLYAALAICNQAGAKHDEAQREHADHLLWEMAKQVQGWGRIHTIERLANTQVPEIKAWLLREGYKNGVTYEYLAHTCAAAGDLRGALAAEEVDDGLLLAAGDLLQAMIQGQGGLAKGIDDYAHAAAATEAYLKHLNGRANGLDQFLILKTIERFLSEDEHAWVDRFHRGWTPEAQQSMLVTVQTLLADEKWLAMAKAGLQTKDPREFWTAAQATEALGIDTWPEYYSRAKAGEPHWFQLMQSKDRSRIEKVVQLAEAQLPLSEIASGPGTELGLGAKFAHHRALGFILQDLGPFPGLGWNLVKAGSRSPVIANRNMAICALAQWGTERWPPEARGWVERCREEEPNEDVKESLAKLLAGELLATRE